MLTYNEQGHAFWDGKRVPRTTEICSLLAPRNWNVEKYYLNKGRIIHLIIKYENQQVLDEESVDPSLVGYLYAHRNFKDITGFKPTQTEYQFYSKRYGFVGRVDEIGPLFNYMSILDVKSGQPHEADTYQVPAYLFGLKDNGIKVWQGFDLYLKANGTYKLEEVKKPSVMFQKFLGGIQKWKEVNYGNM